MCHFDTAGITRSVQAKINGTKQHYIARDLEEAVQYVFFVKARTTINWGRPRYGNITTGPQPGKLCSWKLEKYIIFVMYNVKHVFNDGLNECWYKF